MPIGLIRIGETPDPPHRQDPCRHQRQHAALSLPSKSVKKNRQGPRFNTAVALMSLSTFNNIQMFEHENTRGRDMPHRMLVTKELADFLSVLSHPHRIRIIEELRDAERDVNSLQEVLGISHSGVSQHLMVLRSHRLVSERREGRRVFYHLLQPEIASWLMDATRFLVNESAAAAELRKAINKTRKNWAAK